MSTDQILQDAEKKMKGAVDHLIQDFATYRTGRANITVLDRVHVEAYGSEQPVSQIANISIPEPRQIFIQPYDRSLTPAIERAIIKAELGISPVNDGTGIRLNFPQMTEDRRKEMVKQVHARTEQAKVAIRNVRRDANDHLKAMEKKKEISSDDLKGSETRAQKITDAAIAHADELSKKKEQELLVI